MIVVFGTVFGIGLAHNFGIVSAIPISFFMSCVLKFTISLIKINH